jgi:alpha-beta hydrolase superfamily lysophospholipase
MDCIFGTKRERTVFGADRKLDIPNGIVLDEPQIQATEQRFGGSNCEHGWLDSCVDGVKLHYRKWMPTNEATQQQQPPVAIIIASHGIQSHSGVCAYRAQRLNQQGYALFCHDYYGHGYSEGTRWLIPKTWKNSLADYCTFVNLVANQHTNVPVFLMGESFGGVLSIHLARQFQETGAACGAFAL